MPTVDRSQESQAPKLHAEDEVVLQNLRSAWLADVAAAPEKYAPRPLTRKMKFQRNVDRIQGRIAHCLGSLRKSAGRAISARAERGRTRRENSNGVIAQNSAVSKLDAGTLPINAEKRTSATPSAPLEPLKEKEVLLHLRKGWLAEVEASPEKHAPKPVTWTMKLRRSFEPIGDELGFWLECIKEFALRAMSPKAKRREVQWGEKAKRAEIGRRFVSAFFVGMVVVSVLLYLTMVQHIFDADRLSQAIRK